MPNTYFQFKQFTVHHERCAMKVTTDACLFGAWVATAISNKQGIKSNAKLLDVGTGSGLLSLMVAQKNEGLIDAVEIDKAAAEQAKENVVLSSWNERINIIHADVLRRQTATKYDCIFSNPPFYQNELKSSKESKNVAHHDEGLKLSELFSFIKNHLTEEGSFFLLLPAKREKETETLLQANELYLRQKIFVQQTSKHLPFRMMIEGCRTGVENITKSIVSIKNEAGNYSTEAISLLKDYYLFL